MPEKTRDVQTVIINYSCDKEGCDGELLPTGVMLPTFPPKYSHKCSKCEAEKTFQEKYPKLGYRELTILDIF